MNRKDAEASVCISDRRLVFLQFEQVRKHAICDIKYDIHTLLQTESKFFEPQRLSHLVNFVQNEMKLRYTTNIQYIKEIKNALKIKTNPELYQWCRQSVKYLMYRIHEYHVKFLFAILAGWITMDDLKDDKMWMPYNIIRNNKKVTTKAPIKQTPPSYALWFCNVLQMTVEEPKSNIDNKIGYFRIRMINEAGIQNVSDGLAAIDGLFQAYFNECWQDKPL